MVVLRVSCLGVKFLCCLHLIYGYVRGSPNGKICKSTNGTVGTIFTNGNQKTLNVFLLPKVPLVPMVPLVDHMVEFLSYWSIHLTCFCLSYLLHVYYVIYNIYISIYDKNIAYLQNS